MRRLHPIDPDLAADIAARRRRTGITQNTMALALGVSESIINKIETCRTPITPERRAAVEQVLDEAEARLASVGGVAACAR